jgi:hypothetical protein
MLLPKVEHPVFEIYIKSLNKKVKFRPFLVKEEKVLLIAKESKDSDEIRNAIKQIITNCAVESIDTDALPLFDIEMIFLMLRARSVGEAVKLAFNCQNPVGTDANGDPIFCNTDTDYVMDLSKVSYQESPECNNTVMISDTVGIRLHYPSLAMNIKFDKDEEAYNFLLKMVIQNIEYIFDKESVYKPEDLKEEDLIEFLGSLTLENMSQIQKFFSTIPKVILEDKVTCKKCGFEHTMKTEDLLSFFI